MESRGVKVGYLVWHEFTNECQYLDPYLVLVGLRDLPRPSYFPTEESRFICKRVETFWEPEEKHLNSNMYIT